MKHTATLHQERDYVANHEYLGKPLLLDERVYLPLSDQYNTAKYHIYACRI